MLATQEQLEWLADEVVEAGGEAGRGWAGWVRRSQERRLAASWPTSVAADYEAVIAEIEASAARPIGGRRIVDRLRRELRRIGRGITSRRRERGRWPAPRSSGWQSRWWWQA